MMSGAFWFRAVLVWIHLVAAMLWIGGMLFLSVVVAPLLRKESPQLEPRGWFVQVARRFRVLVWVAIPLLLFTGLLLLPGYISWSTPFSEWSWVIQVKLTAVVMLIGASIVHDRLIGPRVRVIGQKSQAAWTRCERWLVLLSPWLARLTLLLGLAVLFLGIVLVRL